jgi:hypothetical protein
MIPHTLHHFAFTWDVFYDMFHGADFAFPADDFSGINHDVAFDDTIFSNHGSDRCFKPLELVINLYHRFTCYRRETIPDDASFADDGV